MQLVFFTLLLPLAVRPVQMLMMKKTPCTDWREGMSILQFLFLTVSIVMFSPSERSNLYTENNIIAACSLNKNLKVIEVLSLRPVSFNLAGPLRNFLVQMIQIYHSNSYLEAANNACQSTRTQWTQLLFYMKWWIDRNNLHAMFQDLSIIFPLFIMHFLWEAVCPPVETIIIIKIYYSFVASCVPE